MNNVVYFEIQSTNPEREVAFYSTVFGWAATRDEMIPIPYYRIETDGIAGAILQRHTDIQPERERGTNAFTCSVQVENFDMAAECILKNGGQVAMPKFAIPGKCWQGYFLDPDQNVFGVFQADENAGK